MKLIEAIELVDVLVLIHNKHPEQVCTFVSREARELFEAVITVWIKEEQDFLPSGWSAFNLPVEPVTLEKANVVASAIAAAGAEGGFRVGVFNGDTDELEMMPDNFRTH